MKLKTIIGFAGGGGVEAGMIAAGVSPSLSIEFDPDRPELSKAIADTHQQNFKHPLLRITVQEWGKHGFTAGDGVDIAHFSPVCCNFSTETNRGDLGNDLSSAVAIADFIEIKQPRSITLENVPAYARSHSWQIILRSLLKNGYIPNTQIVNFADYGIPQSRKRLFCVAIKGAWFPQLIKQNQVSWHQSIKPLIPTLEETALTANQQRAVDLAINNSDKFYQRSLPVLVPRIGYRGIPRLTPNWKPCPTIKRSIFDDGRGQGRSQTWTIWDGVKAYNCDIEIFRRLQTFPDWYQFPDDIRVAGSIIGNSIPPLFIEKVYTVLSQILDRKIA